MPPVYIVRREKVSFTTWRRLNSRITSMTSKGRCVSTVVVNGKTERVGVGSAYIKLRDPMYADTILYTTIDGTPEGEINAYLLARYGPVLDAEGAPLPGPSPADTLMVCSDVARGGSGKLLILRNLLLARAEHKAMAELHALPHVFGYYPQFKYIQREFPIALGTNATKEQREEEARKANAGYLFTKNMTVNSYPQQSNYNAFVETLDERQRQRQRHAHDARQGSPAVAAAAPPHRKRSLVPSTPQTETALSSPATKRRKTTTSSSSSPPPPGLYELVWVQAGRHPWWPAQVADPTLIRKASGLEHAPSDVFVVFFGDGNYGWYPRSKVLPFAAVPPAHRHDGSPGRRKAVAAALAAISPSGHP